MSHKGNEETHEWWRDTCTEENQKVKASFYCQGKKYEWVLTSYVLIIVLSQWLVRVFSSSLFWLGRFCVYVCVCVCVCVCVHVWEKEICLYILYYGILGVMGPNILFCRLYVPSPQEKTTSTWDGKDYTSLRDLIFWIKILRSRGLSEMTSYLPNIHFPIFLRHRIVLWLVLLCTQTSMRMGRW